MTQGKIKQTNMRQKDGQVFGPDVYEKSLAKTLESLLLYEIGYGGTVTDLMPTKVTVLTRVMGCIDTVTLEGSEEDMELIVEAATLSIATDPYNDANDMKYREAVIDRIMSATSGSPLRIKLMGDMIKGESHLKVLLISLILKEEQTINQYGSVLVKLKAKDLFALFTLVRLDNVELSEAIALAV
jgi:hypothetical protein